MAKVVVGVSEQAPNRICALYELDGNVAAWRGMGTGALPESSRMGKAGTVIVAR